MKPNKEEKDFGKRTAEMRKGLGLTQLELAKKMGVSRTTIANIENGHQRTMLEHAFMLRKILGVRL